MDKQKYQANANKERKHSDGAKYNQPARGRPQDPESDFLPHEVAGRYPHNAGATVGYIIRALYAQA